MASTLTFELRRVDGTPADPPSFQSVAPLWRPGDTIPLGRRTLRVIGVRHDDGADRRGHGRHVTEGSVTAVIAVIDLPRERFESPVVRLRLFVARVRSCRARWRRSVSRLSGAVRTR
jgi:hypothetical protein